MITAIVIGGSVRIIEVLQTQKRLAGAKCRRDHKAVQDLQAKMQHPGKGLRHATPEF